MRNVLFTLALLLMAMASGCSCYHAQGTNNDAKCTARPDCRQNVLRAFNTYGTTNDVSSNSDFPVTYRNNEDYENRYLRNEWIFQPGMAFPCASHIVLPQR